MTYGPHFLSATAQQSRTGGIDIVLIKSYQLSHVIAYKAHMYQ